MEWISSFFLTGYAQRSRASSSFFILTNKCETKNLHENEAKGPLPLWAPQPRFRVKLISSFIGQKNNFFIMHVLKKDVLLVCT
jgi:hypothetical protein